MLINRKSCNNKENGRKIQEAQYGKMKEITTDSSFETINQSYHGY